MKLLDILQELERPSKIYADRDIENINYADLTPAEKDELFKKGTLMLPLPSDPNRPETSGSKVINLPKMDQVKRQIINNKKEFDIFLYSPDPEIKEIAKEINSLHNKLFKALTALDKTIELKRRGRI